MANLKLLQIDHLGEVTNIVGIGTTTAGFMGTVVGVSTTSDANVGYTYDSGSGTFTAPTQPTVTTEQHWAFLRSARDRELVKSDWTQFTDSPLSSSKKTEWATYRQQLRDLPANTSDPSNPTFPTRPS